ncbi:hypothetical protein FQZ97_921520 [compost metagenome]
MPTVDGCWSSLASNCGICSRLRYPISVSSDGRARTLLKGLSPSHFSSRSSSLNMARRCTSSWFNVLWPTGRAACPLRFPEPTEPRAHFPDNRSARYSPNCSAVKWQTFGSPMRSTVLSMSLRRLSPCFKVLPCRVNHNPTSSLRRRSSRFGFFSNSPRAPSPMIRF